MTIDYKGTNPVNLQDAIRDINTRLAKLEGAEEAPAKPTVTERVDGMLKDAQAHLPGANVAPAHTTWTPAAPPKKA
jgi:hypothetical protein